MPDDDIEIDLLTLLPAGFSVLKSRTKANIRLSPDDEERFLDTFHRMLDEHDHDEVLDLIDKMKDRRLNAFGCRGCLPPCFCVVGRFCFCG